MSSEEILAKHSGTISPTFTEKDLSYYLRTLKNDFSEMAEVQTLKLTPSASHKNIVVLLTGNSIGWGDEKLGAILMEKFMAALAQSKIKPKAVILINNAVCLASTDSPCVGQLTALIEQEVSILICDVSAKAKKLEDKIRIGNMVSMNVICDNLLAAWKVITL